VSPIQLAVRRPVLTTVVITVFVVLGLSSYQRLVVDLLPEVEFPFITVTTLYPGAGPEEMESQVTEKLEDAVSTLADIRRLDSISQEGVSLLMIEFELGVDVDLAGIDVKEKVEEVLTELPEDVEKPQVVKFDINAFPIVSLALRGPQSLRDLYEVADRKLRDELSRATGVASVDIVGGLKREIQVQLDPERLRAYGLEAAAVGAAIGRENVNIPAGRVTRSDQEFSLRVLGEFTDLDQLRHLPVSLGATGRTIRVGDLGRVIDGSEEARDLAMLDGENAVALFVVKRTDANTIETASEIRRTVEELSRDLPEGMTLGIIRDNSEFIRQAVRDVLVNIGLGILLTTILLYLFLHSIRTTLVAAVAMPTSIVATFLLIDFGGFTINIMTLLALGISIGVLVANAIVVLENIARRIDERGEDPRTAAWRGTEEVAVAVAATALTNVVVFTPIAFMGSIIGRFFLQFGLTVVFATLFSLVVSFTLTPMLASKFFHSKEEQERRVAHHGKLLHRFEAPFLALAKVWEGGYLKVEDGYRKSLVWAITHRIRTGALVAGIFVGSLMLFRVIGGEFMPQTDDGFLTVQVELPAGTPLERTRGLLDEVMDIVRREVPEQRSMLATVGGENQGVEDGQIVVRLVPLEERERGLMQVINELRPTLAGIPAAEIGIMASDEERKDIIAEVLGPDLDQVQSWAERLRDRVAAIPGLVDVDVSAKPGKPEIVFRPDREELADRMLPVAGVGQELRTLYEGQRASVYREGGEEYDIRVRLEEEERRRVTGITEMRVASARGPSPVEALGDLERDRGLAEITRKDKERMVSVTANIGSGSLVQKVEAIQAEVADMGLPPGYRVEYAGQFEWLQESVTEINKALLLAIVLTYLLLAAILESFVHPITIMFTLPLGLVGMALSLFFSGATTNIFSLMAMVMLVGIVVNNAILILDLARRYRDEGRNAIEAIAEAGPRRLRPIVMTTLAIVVGILPQALGGAGAAYTVAMAVVTMGGVLAAGILSLYLIPVVYTLFDRLTVVGRRQRRA
jgi:HAE1 family hydrophobic/amphiphilic exporter-1